MDDNTPDSRVQHVTSHMDVQVTTSVTSPPSPNERVKKVVVAVHGVGDQYTYATIQSVVNQFCGFYDHPAGVPLGNFHTGTHVFSLPPPYPSEPFERFAFAEVYWAKFPRKVVDDKHTLEESKKWARTIVERLRLRARLKAADAASQPDFGLIKQVLAEMIQTVAVLDRVCYVAERAGLFSFDLRRLLEDYLGDVQIVTEFESTRVQILGAFDEVMGHAHATFPAADIHVIAHSEGTVVALLGFLKAFREETRPDWVSSVRGFMTLGSPIDKHLVLWPELFGETPPRSAPDQPIQWHNYYDHGDPIGFALDDARAWLQDQKWDGVFDFPPEHDHGFTRYAFPGKAHIDYWNDDAVFGHFIKHVVTETPAEPARFQQPPQDRLQAKWLSYALPYAGVFALLAAAVFILYKAVVEATAPNAPELHASGRILVEVLRTSLVLLGITIAARVPRLTRHVGLRLTALGAAALTCAVYFGVAQVLPASGPAIFDLPPGATTAILAGVVVALSYVLAVFLPSWGVTPMMLAGALVVGGKVAWHVMTSEARDTGEVWPVFFATAVFLYLWWLAALTFDLVVIWHWYIRHAQILARMDEILGGTRGGPERARTPGIAPPAGYAPQEQR